MKTPFYLGQVDEDGLHLVQRLPDDETEARAIVNQMNRDMGTAYVLIGEVLKPMAFDLLGTNIPIKSNGVEYSCVVDEVQYNAGPGMFPTMEVSLRGYPKV